jgi:hypothetical protein
MIHAWPLWNAKLEDGRQALMKAGVGPVPPRGGIKDQFVIALEQRTIIVCARLFQGDVAVPGQNRGGSQN